jgi:ribonucleotide monophosphatase NagD (HAD superfamily)
MVIVDIDQTLLYGTSGIKKVIDYVNSLAATKKIVIVTGRPESQRKATETALSNNGVKYNQLIMNPGSTATSIKYKTETAKALLKIGSVYLAIDDNVNARQAYQSLGIRAVNPKTMQYSLGKKSA